MKFTTIIGDAIDGFRCLGLFETAGDAVAFGVRVFGHEKTWRVMPILIEREPIHRSTQPPL